MIVGIIALSETAAFGVANDVLSSSVRYPVTVLYPVTVILIVVFILSLTILWVPVIPTATDFAEFFSRRGKGAIFRWTKDSLAIVVTATFLTWFVASLFVPLWYHPAHDVIYGTNGENLLGWDILVFGICFVVYLAVGDYLPARVSVRAT